MLLKEIKNIFHKELDPQFGKSEVAHFFYYFVEHFLDLPRFHLAIHPQWIITKEEESHFFKGLAELKNGVPVQYILGSTTFMDLRFMVNEHVLIPRPETEELVQWVIEDHKSSKKMLNVLDIGTGSGCIAIALAKYLPSVHVTALDVSKEALAVARYNAKVNKVNMECLEADVRTLEIGEDAYDIIISNPPYVLEKEKPKMQDHVKNAEPALALFVPDLQPLLYYEYIAKVAKKGLRKGGGLYLEINEQFGKEVSKLLTANNLINIEVRQDLHGKDRFIKSEVYQKSDLQGNL